MSVRHAVQPETAILALAVLLGISVGLIDAVLDYVWFYEGTFLELLVTDVPTHEVYIRSMILASFAVFGVVVSRLFARHRRAENALRESEKKFRAIFEQAAIGVAQIETPTGQFVWVNQRYCDILGLTPDEMTAATFMDITHPDDLQEDLDNMERLKAGEIREFSMDKRYFRRDDSIVWVNLTVSPMWEPGESQNCHVAVVEDITERRQALEELHQYEHVVSSANDMLALVDQRYRYLVANAAYLQAFAKTADEVIGRTVAEVFGEEFFSTIIRPRAKRCMTGEDIRYQDWFEFPAVGRKYMDVAYSPFLGPDTEIRGFVVTARDITERKRADEANCKAQEVLLEQQRHETERVETELAKVREELVRTTRLAAIGQVAASIAHDLRNPLGAAGNACYFLKRYGSGEKAQLEEYLDIINQELGTAHSVIDSLLSMAWAKEPAKGDVDLGDLISEVFRGIQTNDKVACRIALSPEPFFVKVDPNQMRQVVVNLVKNATQAMGDRGDLLIEASRAPDADTIVFRDTGPGVAPRVLDKLFEPLITTKAKGTGLGLTICRQIIERHGGTIEAANHDDGGAVFTVHLPRE